MSDAENLLVFIEKLKEPVPPDSWHVVLKSLWHDKKGDWNKAHDLVQEGNSPDEAYVHAYLHRKEGDIWNSDYWYRRAGRKRPEISLEDEWTNLLTYFLTKGYLK